MTKEGHRLRGLLSLLASGVASLLVVSGLGLAIGFDLAATFRGTLASALAHYVVAAGVIGPTVVLAWRRGARFTAGVAAIAVGGTLLTRTPGEIAHSLTRLNIVLTSVAVLLVLVFGAEYGLRNPAAVREVFTPRATAAGAVAGTLHVVAILVLRPWFGLSTAYFYTLTNVVFTMWWVGGVFLVGMGAILSAIRYRLVAPSLVVGAAFSWAVYVTWTIRHELRTDPSLVGAPLNIYILLWFVVAAIALAAGLVERRLHAGNIGVTLASDE